MSNLSIPDNWADAKLIDLADLNMGQSPPSADVSKKPIGLPLVGGAANLKPNGIFSDQYVKSPTKISKADDIILCIRATIGRLAIAERPYCIGRGVVAITPKAGMNRDFLKYLIQQSSNYLAANATGSTFRQVDKTTIANMPVGVPPISEQKRIVAKIESTQEKIKTIEESVSKAEELIGKYRESLLQKAFRGQLVPQEPNDEPASELLKRIRAERAQATDGKKKKKEDLPPICEDEIPFEIPKSWEWMRLSDLGELQRGKSKHRPRNDPKLFGGKYPFIQTGDVASAKDGTITQFHQTLSEFGIKQSKLFPQGTLCITIAANIADTGILGFECAFPDSVVGFTPSNLFKTTHLISKYIQLYIQFTKNEIDRKAHGAAQKNINLEFLDSLLIPVPPQNHINVILSKLEKSDLALNQIKQSLDVLKNTKDKFNNSIFSNAFTGALVPQISSEGTGQALLLDLKNDISSREKISSAPSPRNKRVKK